MNCLHCGQAFNGKRADAKFCSVKCRVACSRNTKDVTATRNAEAVTDNLPTDPYELLRDYELIKITSDVGTPNESTLKIIAPKQERSSVVVCRCPDCGRTQEPNYDGPYRLEKLGEGEFRIMNDNGIRDQEMCRGSSLWNIQGIQALLNRLAFDNHPTRSLRTHYSFTRPLPDCQAGKKG